MDYEQVRFDRRSSLGRLLSYPLILMVVIAIQAMSLWDRFRTALPE